MKRSAFRTVMVFAAVGPLTGGLVLGLVVFGERALAGGGSEAGEFLWGVLMLGLAGYVYGCIPAIITGMAAAHVSRQARNTRSWLGMAAGLGAAFSGLMSLLLGAPGLALLLSPLGAVAAVVCGLAALGVRPLGDGSPPMVTIRTAD
ncbi:MAG: hypothetical protein Q8S53_10160 [Brevundimonas sp.]|uniref:hypothetical protein n=1 Tax=Brevundimonas sp. TaxID=1871086 RepID=UPI002733F725|nr:hypothetical protein [Brevundimonas sp.]MDP3378717.1 hypothetical protein [Brevundimonas sp.]